MIREAVHSFTEFLNAFPIPIDPKSHFSGVFQVCRDQGQAIVSKGFVVCVNRIIDPFQCLVEGGRCNEEISDQVFYKLTV